MPRFSIGTAVVVGCLLWGCAADRAPMVLIEPEFSYLRDAGPLAADLTEVEFAPLELADAPFDPSIPVELTEPSLLRPARTLVQGELPQAQP